MSILEYINIVYTNYILNKSIPLLRQINEMPAIISYLIVTFQLNKCMEIWQNYMIIDGASQPHDQLAVIIQF